MLSPALTPEAPREPDAPRRGGFVPPASDPRWPFAALLATYALLGVAVLGFNRSPEQILLTVAFACALDVGLARVLKGRWIFPLSAFITGLGLSLLLNYSHTNALLAFPVLFAIGSKYLITFKGKHAYNPAQLGVVISLVAAHELITAAPAYQWGGTVAMGAFIAMAGAALVLFRVDRTVLVLTFLAVYAAQTAFRAWLLREILPPETLFLGTVASAPFFLFTFYMITDPATSPAPRRDQVKVGIAIAMADFALQFVQSVFTFFYAAFIVASWRFIGNHWRASREEGVVPYVKSRLFSAEKLRTAGVLATVLAGLLAVYAAQVGLGAASRPLAFKLEKVDVAAAGLGTEMSTILEETDPRVRHMAKWLLSVGDAVAVGDYDGDGKMDLFLTNPLKRPEDRLALYRNAGDWRFERVVLPSSILPDPDPAVSGLASSALFVDYDNDGDSDLLLPYGFGRTQLLRNLLTETGKATFTNATAAAGLGEHAVSLAANAFDYDRDGRLDLLVANAQAPYLPGYETPTPFNVFKLPAPAYEGDRRMFAIMYNSWHDATNGGENVLYRNVGGGRFEKTDARAMGMPETHWTLAVGTADFNGDGYTDLYCASDFGPDDLYLNREGRRFERVAGRFFGDVGKDTYKGMNATVADFDRNGRPDVYISNVHHELQAEGSLLWMNHAGADPFRPRFVDEATKRGVLNEHRFGWGAAAGDLDADGWVDLIQANGMVDDRLDRNDEFWKDYWYYNHKLMQAGPELYGYIDKWADLRGRTIYPNEARRLYLNQGDRDRLQFVDVAEAAGVAEPDNSRGVAMVDLDDDGDLDVVVTNQHGPVSLYRNTLDPRGGWVGLALTGNGRDTARMPIGTRVKLSYTEHGRSVVHALEVRAANGFSAQGDPRLHVGLGGYSGPVDATVTWAGSGKTTFHAGLVPGTYHAITQP